MAKQPKNSREKSKIFTWQQGRGARTEVREVRVCAKLGYKRVHPTVQVNPGKYDTRLCPHAGIIFNFSATISTTAEMNSAVAKMIFATANII